MLSTRTQQLLHRSTLKVVALTEKTTPKGGLSDVYEDVLGKLSSPDDAGRRGFRSALDLRPERRAAVARQRSRGSEPAAADVRGAAAVLDRKSVV